MSKLPARHKIALAITLVVLCASCILIYQRGGALAWLGLLVSAALVFKGWKRPSTRDLPVSLIAAALWVLAWPITFYYVITTWETGEVIELTVDTASGKHAARTWIMEQQDSLMLYYDAPPPAAQALLAGAPLSIKRDDHRLSLTAYKALSVDDLPEDTVNKLFALMNSKYPEQNTATNVFFGVLGRSRDKVGILIEAPIEAPIEEH